MMDRKTFLSSLLDEENELNILLRKILCHIYKIKKCSKTSLEKTTPKTIELYFQNVYEAKDNSEILPLFENLGIVKNYDLDTLTKEEAVKRIFLSYSVIDRPCDLPTISQIKETLKLINDEYNKLCEGFTPWDELTEEKRKEVELHISKWSKNNTSLVSIPWEMLKECEILSLGYPMIDKEDFTTTNWEDALHGKHPLLEKIKKFLPPNMEIVKRIGKTGTVFFLEGNFAVHYTTAILKIQTKGRKEIIHVWMPIWNSQYITPHYKQKFLKALHQSYPKLTEKDILSPMCPLPEFE